MSAPFLCPACGAANPGGSRSCAICGGSLERVAMPLAEERKLVTVLFADIGQSLALIQGRDPEAAHALLAPAVARMAWAVEAHGGTVAQRLGDGIMALFGAPAAQEDHATAACLAALAIRDAFHAEGARGPVSVRIGLHSGEVLVTTPPPGSGVVLQPTGEVVHIAARLQQTAAAGTAQASTVTMHLAGPRIQSRALPARRLRGLAVPLATVELLAAAEPPPPQPGASPLVGRETELARLTRLLDEAAAEARFLLLQGEAGAGKSRLAAELVRHAASRGIAVASLSCQPHAEAPLGPLRRLLRALPPGALPDDALALAVLQDPAAADDAWRREEPALRRRRMLAAGAARIAGVSRPLLLLVEDAHWLEPESAACLALVPAVARAGLMLLATARDEDPPAGMQDSGMRDWARIALAPLAPSDALDLARALLHGMVDGIEPRMAERLVAQLASRAGGNPFFAEQIAAAWREAGPGAGSAALPDRLRGVLAARIDHLAPEDKALAEVAAVIGTDFAAPLLAQASASAPAAFDAGLLRLQQAGLLRAAEDGALGFSHALLRDAVDAGLTRGRRRALHAACLEALTTLHAGRPDAEARALVRHAEGADLPEAIVRHARAAARQDILVYANQDAVGHFDMALAALARLPDEAATRRLRLETLLGLRDPLFRLGDIARIRTCLAEAAALAARLEDPVGIAQAAILSSHAHWMAGDPVAAKVDADRAAALAASSDDAALALRAQFQLGLTHLATGALVDAALVMGQVAEALVAGRVPHGKFGLDFSLAATAAGYQARALAECGALAEAAEAVQVAEAAAERDTRPFARIFASNAAAAVAMAGGHWAAAIARCTGAVEWCRAADARLMRPVALSLLGQAQLGGGLSDAALESLTDAVAEADRMGFRIHQAGRLALLAEAFLATGDRAAAARTAARARTIARRCGERAGAAAAQRVAALAGDAAAARRGLAAAGRAAQALGLAPLAARCASEAARLGPAPSVAAARRAAG